MKNVYDKIFVYVKGLNEIFFYIFHLPSRRMYKTHGVIHMYDVGVMLGRHKMKYINDMLLRKLLTIEPVLGTIWKFYVLQNISFIGKCP